ncbi:glycosyl transferase [Cellulomonas phragmiteti]|uniref:Glycosyl transferase n=1 Tax=Cellulomonas phragmiteti TaxID=478780 RepID=A0ABQ4DIP5_9CELL|nr:glycosyl transferase [Cellulomonas phragmiteti]
MGPGAGGNAARDAGIRAAAGNLIALLDDDDVWHDGRLETQLNAIRSAGLHDHDAWIASCSVQVSRSGQFVDVWPHDVYDEVRPLAEYLFARTAARGGTGFIQASTLLFPRWLALDVPFDAGLRFHQDVTWLLETVRQHSRLRILQIKAPLVVYRVGAASVSSAIRADASTEWALEYVSRHSRRALGDFLLTQPVYYARAGGNLPAALRAVRLGIRRGRPSASAVAYAFFTVGRIVVDRSFGHMARA